MKTLLIALLCTLTIAAKLSAQVATPTPTYRASMFSDRLGIDGGLYFPMGDIKRGLDLSTAWGMNFNFWRFIDDRVVGVVSVGTSFYQLGNAVPTDTATIDLSELSMNATPIMGGIGYVFGTQDLHPYVMAHAGATLITVNLGARRPSEEINNEAYFTLGATAGVGYAASARLTITSSVRYTKMFREDLQTLSVLFGIAYHL